MQNQTKSSIKDSEEITFKRRDGRSHSGLRRVKASFNLFGYAAGSVLFQMGNTKVLCSATMQNGVPPFLKGKKTGWLNAEYSMLPTSSHNRIIREATSMRKNGRSVEISRLIGRSLRTIVNLDLIGERTIYIDCDVLQADGGTRTACITGACLALRAAQEYWLKRNFIKENILTDHIAAVSVGVISDSILLDLNYEEDSIAGADFNFMITRSNKIVEIQGGAEKALVDWDQFAKVKDLSCLGIKDLFKVGDDLFDNFFNNNSLGNNSLENNQEKQHTNKNYKCKTKAPLFSLLNR